jgi:hypothetical protein
MAEAQADLRAMLANGTDDGVVAMDLTARPMSAFDPKRTRRAAYSITSSVNASIDGGNVSSNVRPG